MGSSGGGDGELGERPLSDVKPDAQAQSAALGLELPDATVLGTLGLRDEVDSHLHQLVEISALESPLAELCDRGLLCGAALEL